jgi:hypothetical protein
VVVAVHILVTAWVGKQTLCQSFGVAWLAVVDCGNKLEYWTEKPC